MNIAVYSGSFNPIHNAHIALSRFIVDHKPRGIEQVWLMVTPRNPLKPYAEMVPDSDRLEMTRLACKELNNIMVSDFEIKLNPPFYSLKTLNKLSEKYPQHKFHLVIGADNWHSITQWYKPEEIISNYGLIIYPRPGFSINSNTLPENVIFLSDAPLSTISSTEVRKLIAQGEDVSSLIPTSVANFIQKHNLYSVNK